MTTPTLPLVATRIDGDGPYWAAWSPIHSGSTDGIVWLSEPQLPNPAYYRWATDAEVTCDHVTLNVGALAELVFLSGTDPDALDDDGVMAIVGTMLRRLGCDMRECAAEVGDLMGAGRETTGPLFNRCVTRAARLLGVSL